MQEFAVASAAKSSALTLSSSSSSRLNSTTAHLQISKFELRLLSYFNQVYLNDQTVENPGWERIWKIEFPLLWQQSDLVRHSVFLLTAMILWNICDLEAMYKEDFSPLDIGRSDFSAGSTRSRTQSIGSSGTFETGSSTTDLGIESAVSYYHRVDRSAIEDIRQIAKEEYAIETDNMEKLKELLFDKLTDYFVKSLKRTYKVMDTIQRQNMSVKSEYQAAEIVISGILLFSFLALQPHGLVPLITLDPNVTDLVSMVKGIKVSMGKSFPYLYNSGYSGLFHASEHLFPPVLTEDDVFPLCENLKRNFREYLKGQPTIGEEGRRHFEEAFRLLDIVIYRTIESNRPMAILRYIFLFDVWILDEAKQRRNIFALKILFTYSCLCLMSKLRLFSEGNIYLDFLHWYRQFNINLFGEWRYPDDEAFFELIITDGLAINNSNYDLLKTFDPLLYSIEN